MPWGRGSWLWRQEAPGSILASVGAGGGVSRCNHNRWAFVDISQITNARSCSCPLIQQFHLCKGTSVQGGSLQGIFNGRRLATAQCPSVVGKLFCTTGS